MASEEQARWEAQTLLDASAEARAGEATRRQLERGRSWRSRACSSASQGLTLGVQEAQRAVERAAAEFAQASRKAPSRSSARCASARRRCTRRSTSWPPASPPAPARQRRMQRQSPPRSRAAAEPEPAAEADEADESEPEPRRSRARAWHRADLEDAAEQLDDAGAEDAQEEGTEAARELRRARG